MLNFPKRKRDVGEEKTRKRSREREGEKGPKSKITEMKSRCCVT